MKKKILAIISITLVIILAFAACKKKEITLTDKEGKTHICVTDKEGNTVLDKDGNIMVYETDANGKKLKDESGNDKTLVVTFPAAIINGSVLETAYYKLTLPEGWTANDRGIAYKDGNENSYLNIIKDESLQDGESFEQRFEIEKQAATERCQSTIEMYPNSTLEFSDCELTDEKYKGGVMEIKVIDETGTVKIHNIAVYYLYGTDVYVAQYMCFNDAYDESFDIIDMLNKNLHMK